MTTYLTSTRGVGPDRYPEHATPEDAFAAAIRSGCLYRAPGATRYCAADLTNPESDPVVLMDRQLGWGDAGQTAYVYVEGACRKHANAMLRRIARHRAEATR